MRGLQITLFVIALLILGTQTFRHVYVKWIAPTSSVLDAFRPQIEEDVAASKDLDELRDLYAKAWQDVQAYEKTASAREQSDDEGRNREPYRTERTIRAAIEQWEAQSRAVFELRFYWLAGLLSIVLGVLAYARINRWLGMVGIITGFTEMTVWTSPLWRGWGPQAQFERLLNQKLLFSVISVVLLVALWLWYARRESRREAGAPGVAPV